MDWFWHALWICFVVIPVSILWIICMVSIFVRRDLSVWARIGWVLAVLIVPVFGAIVYLLFSPSSLWRDTGTMPMPSRPATVTTPEVETTNDSKTVNVG